MTRPHCPEHPDRQDADTAWIEVCKDCSLDFCDYIKLHPDEWPRINNTSQPMTLVLAAVPTNLTEWAGVSHA